MDYREFAVRYVRWKCKLPHMVKSACFDEIVSIVMVAAYDADRKFDINKCNGYGTEDHLRKQFRMYYASCAIMNYVNDYKRMKARDEKRKNAMTACRINYNSLGQWAKDKMLTSPDEEVEQKEEHSSAASMVQYLLNKSSLTDLQKKCIVDHYLKGKTQKEISQSFDPPTSSQNVNLIIKNGITKMRETAKLAF